ncbi:MAG: hypothetical protein SF187_14100 [Deltaproteobacteria bacterium]|nr:hypothetical protein [Deltaproteobacteria bacterium]
MFWLLFASGAITLSAALDATAVKVVATDVTCPQPQQVQAALAERSKATVDRGAFRLELYRLGDQLNITLRNQLDEPVLERSFDARNSACEVLADTVALVVTRYLHDFDYRAPTTLTPRTDAELPPGIRPSMPAVRALAVAFVGSVRVPTPSVAGAQKLAIEPGLLLQLQSQGLAWLGQLDLAVPHTDTAPTGTAIKVQSAGLSLGVGLPWNRRWSSLTPSLEAGARLHWVQQIPTGSAWRPEPFATARVRWLAAFHSVVVGLDIHGGLSIQPRSIKDTEGNALFATPRALAGGALLLGWGRIN